MSPVETLSHHRLEPGKHLLINNTYVLVSACSSCHEVPSITLLALRFYLTSQPLSPSSPPALPQASFLVDQCRGRMR